MDIYIFDTDLTIVGVVDTFVSLIWVRRYFTAGSFEIVVPLTSQTLSLIAPNRLVVRTDRKETGLISAMSISTDSDGNEIITASGYFMEGVLARRVLYRTGDYSSLLTMLDNNVAGNCIDENRRIPYLSVDKSIDVPSEYNLGLKYKNLAEYAEAVCRYNNLGLTVDFIHGAENSFVLRGYYGVDRSIEQTENPQVILCAEYGSMINCNYDYSDDGACTTMYGYTIVSDDTYGGSMAPVYTEGDDTKGYSRLENSVGVNAETYSADVPVFKGYSDTGEPLYETESHKFVDNEATLAAIKAECVNGIIFATDNVSGSVDYAYGYMDKWDLGDIVTVKNDRWNFITSQRITEVSEHYDNSSQAIEPVFGTPQKTISELLRS